MTQFGSGTDGGFAQAAVKLTTFEKPPGQLTSLTVASNEHFWIRFVQAGVGEHFPMKTPRFDNWMAQQVGPEEKP